MSTLYEQLIEEGKQKGSVAATREAVAEFLEARFEAVPSAILERLDCIDDVSALKSLIRKAATAASLEDFRQAMEAVPS